MNLGLASGIRQRKWIRLHGALFGKFSIFVNTSSSTVFQTLDLFIDLVLQDYSLTVQDLNAPLRQALKPYVVQNSQFACLIFASWDTALDEPVIDWFFFFVNYFRHVWRFSIINVSIRD